MQTIVTTEKITILATYFISVFLLGLVALDFMGMNVSFVSKAQATYISPLNNGSSSTGFGYFGSGFWCSHGSVQAYYTDQPGGSDFDSFWYACTS